MTPIKIKGMTCKHCVMAVTKALGRRRGSPRVIADQGYDFPGIPDGAREDPIGAAREQEIRDLKTRFAVGIVLSGIIIFMKGCCIYDSYSRAQRIGIE
jgi:copper chaperone CopZ